jgi:prolyl oligopeptidase
LFFRGVKVRFCFDRICSKSSATFVDNPLIVKCSLALIITLLCNTAVFGQLTYPATVKVDQQDNYHGVVVNDPYRWLEDDTSEATINWVQEQSNLTETYLEGIPHRHALRKRVADFYNYPRLSSPFRNGDHYYYYMNSGLQNFPVLYRQRPMDTVAELVIDPNKLSPDGSLQVTQFVPSRNGRYAAWMISKSGSDWQTILVKDLTTMRDLPDTLNWIKESDIAWQDNGFYYSRYPPPARGRELTSQNQNQQLWFHQVGTPQSQDRLIYHDSIHPLRFYYASTSEDERFVFLSIVERSSKGNNGNALWYLDSQSKDKSFQPIVAEPGEYIYGVVDPVNGGKLLIQTNENAPNSKVILFDPARPQRKYWKTVIPEKEQVLELATLGGGQLFVKYLQDAATRLFVYKPDGKPIREIKLPGLGEADVYRALQEDTVVFYTYRSLNSPVHIFQYHLQSGMSTVFQKPTLLFNPDDYLTSRKFFISRDGTRVPLFMVHKKDMRRNGRNPTVMSGYGGFGYSPGLPYNPSIMPFLEQGGIYVLVNLRGGGEYGEEWHKAGMLHNKRRVFEDFIAAAEYLISRRYTSPSRLAMNGASNGGLLVAAVANQRPDLFRVAVPEVGVMDMLRFQKFTIGWNWIAEYGSSENENDFQNLASYSPIHNIRPGVEYPATLVITADHDDRVVPAHSFKYIATLQQTYQGKRPMLLKLATNAGHGLSSIMKNIELDSDIYSFILYNMGIDYKDVASPIQEKAQVK